MFGKYYDNRVHAHLTKFYTRVPYLDSQIYNIEVNGLRQSRKARNRTVKATQAIQRTKNKSNLLCEGLENSRIQRQKYLGQFVIQLDRSRRKAIERNQNQMQKFAESRIKDKESYMKDQLYLDSLLDTAASKAASRILDVRRWH